MIEKRCKINLGDIDMVEFTCHRCQTTVTAKRVVHEWACKQCGHQFTERERQILEAVAAVTRIKEEKTSFTLSFVSIENESN